MKLNEVELIGDAIETIHKVTGEEIHDIVDALIGVTWDEEDGGQIKNYCYPEETDNQQED